MQIKINLHFAPFVQAISLFSVILLTQDSSQAQEYANKIKEGTWTVQQIQQSADSFFKVNGTGKGSGYTQYKRWEYNALRMCDEQGYLKGQDQLLKEWEKANKEFHSVGVMRRSLNEKWTEWGPSYYNATTSWSPGVGRITAFSVDPSNHQHIIVGAETGGVWNTLDGGNNWTPLGDYFSNLSVYATAIHPRNPSIYYFGSNNGFLYRSLNAGATWQQLAKVGNSNINAITISPFDSSLIFVSVESSGMYRSADAGNTFTRVTTDPASFDILFKPGSASTVYASGIGFHVSQDTGKTFQSFMPSLPLTITGSSQLDGNYFVSDNSFVPGNIPIPQAPAMVYGKLVLFPDNNSHIACGPSLSATALNNAIAVVRRGQCNFTEKVIHAQNAGAIAVLVVNNQGGNVSMGGGDPSITIPAVSIDMETGEKIIQALLGNETIFAKLQNSGQSSLFTSNPKMLGVSEQNPQVLYVLESQGRRFGALYKSENAGLSFTKLNHSQNFLGYSTVGDDENGQAPRDMAIAVNPRNAQEVHIAGILTWKSSNGGLNFECTSDWIPDRASALDIGYCHADVDILKFVGDTLYAGTDGGIFYAPKTDQVNANYFVDITRGLGIRQFYKIGVAQDTQWIISGGSQDNGTSLYTKQNGWIDWIGADGMETFVSNQFHSRVFGTSQNGRPYFTDDLGMSLYYLSLPGSQSGNWVTPFEQSPNGEKVYIAYEQVFETPSGFDYWEPVSPVFPGKLNHLKIAPFSPELMYAAHQRKLYKRTPGTTQWPEIKEFAGSINAIAIHPLFENTIAVATTDSGKVYVSHDGGLQWVSYRKNLPDFSALSLVWNKDTFNSLYLGMNYGVYFIDAQEALWQPFSNQLPNVIVNELEINNVTNKIFAGTYGRGLWVSDAFKRTVVSDTTLVSVRNEKWEPPFSVFPNPFALNFTIQSIDKQTMIKSVEIFDGQGKLIYSRKGLHNDSYQVETRDFAEGIYFIKVGTDRGVVLLRTIKS